MKIGAKIAMQQDESHKTPKMDPKNVFFSKFPQDFELLKQVPESLHQTIYFGRTRVGQSVESALITLAAIFFGS